MIELASSPSSGSEPEPDFEPTRRSERPLPRSGSTNFLIAVGTIKVIAEKDFKVDAHLQKSSSGQNNNPGLLQWPTSWVGMAAHVVSLPAKIPLLVDFDCTASLRCNAVFFRFYTIPDVRLPGNEPRFAVTNWICIIWMVVEAYIMTVCMGYLGLMLGFSPFIMGIVFGAIGTSIPNVWASVVNVNLAPLISFQVCVTLTRHQCVARLGLGDAAICEALGNTYFDLLKNPGKTPLLAVCNYAGGNVFNIFVCLGLPWFLYCFVGTVFNDRTDFVFYGMAGGSIIFPIFILFAVLILFTVALMASGWRLYTWHGVTMCFMYVLFLYWVFSTFMTVPNWG